MDALRKVHAALVPGGLVVETQPVSERPVLVTEDGPLGDLDQQEWLEIVRAVDQRVEQVLHDGLFTLDEESSHVVTDTFGGGPEVVAYVADLVGTRLDDDLAARLVAVAGTVRLRQEVRLRVLRAL